MLQQPVRLYVQAEGLCTPPAGSPQGPPGPVGTQKSRALKVKTPTRRIPTLWKQPPGPVRGRGRVAESLGDLHATAGEAGGTRMRQKAREVSLRQPRAPAGSRHAAQPQLHGAGRSGRQCLLEELSTYSIFGR